MQPTWTRFSTLSHPSFTRLSTQSKPSIHAYPRYTQLRKNHNSTPEPPLQLTGSAKLFADAAKEAAEQATLAEEASDSKSARLTFLEQEHQNWTGDEDIKDVVLRMLVDKYKPLRTGSIQTAEQKLKQAPPKLASVIGTGTLIDEVLSAPVKLSPTSGSWASEPLLPSNEGHQPWHTEFRVPSFDVSSVKLARLPPPVVSSKPSSALPLDDRERKVEKEKRKRTQQAGRLNQAKESTLDYRMGIRGPRGHMGRPSPANIKGWMSLVEDRIEKARQSGLFNSVKGRGKPMDRSMEEHNPFIAREEFLMNRIVKRNGAAPPWVEFQLELESGVNSFREILRQSWIRRAIRGLSTEHPPEILHKLTLQDIKNHRDPPWFAKEKGYHEKAVDELNSLVRKYNGMAPYAVRRPYYIRTVEIDRLYDDCAPEILRTIAERGQDANLPLGGGGGSGSISKNVGHADGSFTEGRFGYVEKVSFIEWIRGLFRRWFGVGA
ncbi:hypothetical protein GALMADRAFT_56018 [Galerina marginata CBS 339.88]|uniref:DnaJ homologue subfamily C member 28 conserved domain-containing protein n=1 Tax=Galerina marginata (strain CBS 339.88) TaxID=685588 RepID=A0A067TM26_GALM3|nr:hypothetical protein GALMADRAFT_56018 [Galerina marginata CBS 339.88]